MSYGAGSAGLVYSTKAVSDGTVATELLTPATIPHDTLWYKLFAGLIDSGALTQLDGKFYLDGIMLSDITSISVGVVSGIVLISRFAGDFLLFLQKRKIAKIEANALKEK